VLHSPPNVSVTRRTTAQESTDGYTELHYSPHARVTGKVTDIADVRALVSLVTPATPDFRDVQTPNLPYLTKGRRPAPCRHQWRQKGRGETCESLAFTGRVLPTKDVSRGDPPAK